MSSKKLRRKLRNFYAGSKPDCTSGNIVTMPMTKQFSDCELDAIHRCFVTFPEIVSQPIKLGVLLKATVQIGNDEPQPERLIYSTLFLDDRDSFVINKKDNLIIASKKVVPVLKVLYPLPFAGYAMYPIFDFVWFGKESISITNIEECPKFSKKINTPAYNRKSDFNFDVMVTGSLMGRIIDGVELFEESAV